MRSIMIKSWTDEAWEEFQYWAKNDKKVFKRILELIKDIDRNGYTGIGKPEALKYGFSGYWSRRITDKHRFIYKLTETSIVVIACANHYEY